MTEQVCPHGMRADDGRYNGWWAAPWSTCTCCGVTFFFVDSGGASSTEWFSRTWTRDRCRECGGRYVEMRGQQSVGPSV